MISRKVFATAGWLALLVMSGLVMALPVANAQTTVVVSMPNGAGSAAAAASNLPGYAPDTITVVIGINNTITFTNNDTLLHTVTPVIQPSGANWAGSGNLPAGQAYTFTFTVPGTYDYHCVYHSWMMGSVIVEASTSTVTSSTTSTHTTPEFPPASLAVILFAVIAAVILVAPRLRPTLSAGSGPTRSRALLTA